jgi:EPS-associated MarR family transcriptional regulator
MVNGQIKEEILNLIKEVETSPEITQRHLAAKLGISLGKTNHLLRELVKVGIIKAKNFSHSSSKISKIKYILTKKGFAQKLDLVYHYLKIKEVEYLRLKEEWDRISKTK